MARDRAKHKGRSGATFVSLPHALLESENFKRLSARAVKLLIDLYCHYNGRNNGDFSATISVMQRRGWKSKQTLALALDELLHYGIIVETRKGNEVTRKAYLYGVTFQGIDECGGKLDVSPNPVALGWWKERREDRKDPAWYRAYKDKRHAKKLKEPTRNPTQSSAESDPVSGNAGTESDPDSPGFRPNNGKSRRSTRSESVPLSTSIPRGTP